MNEKTTTIKYETLCVEQYDSETWPLELILDRCNEALEGDNLYILSYREVDCFHFLSSIGIYYIHALDEDEEVENVIFEYIGS